MKVAICTIFDEFPNYGNKLQNYAMTHILRKYNIKYSSIISNKVKKNKIIQLKVFIKRILDLSLSDYYLEYKKNRKFKEFDNLFLNPSSDYINGKLRSNDYDYFIVGSDQVWNDNWFDGFREDLFLLTFIENKKKVCYAPSFGVSSISEKWKPYFEKYLLLFPQLSVREEAGAKIIKELTGRDAEVLIDPTLLLTKEEWLEISNKPFSKNLNTEGYILNYFLGQQQQKNVDFINQISNENGLKVVSLMDLKQRDIFQSGPQEFISLISNAKLICTDSFQACVFSILFNKPFVVFDRDGNGAGMNSRINTLLDKYDLKKRQYCNIEKSEIFNCEYDVFNKKIVNERKAALKYIENNLNI